VRTVVDSILWLPEDLGRALVIDALQRRLIDVDGLRAGLAAVGRRHGVGRARSILEAVGGVPHSEMEARVHRLLRDAGIGGWTANAAVHDADGLVGYVDLLFTRQRVVVELDGRAYHTDPERFQRDRERQNRLVALGYVVLRFTWDDVVHRGAGLLAQVRDALARAAV
jgi:very-short-patch-repair endonuclease